MIKQLLWERLSKDGYIVTDRAEVEGGWLYRCWTNTSGGDVLSLVFVPKENDKPDERLPPLKEVAKEMIKAAMDTLYKDNHYWSSRGCPTCDSISKMLGFSIGCARFREERK